MHSTPKRTFRRPSPATVIALSALLVASSGVAAGAIPGSSDGTITACYDREAGLADNKKGTLRVIDAEAGQTCNSPRESTLTWKDGSTLLGKTEKAADADKLDGLDSTSLARFAGSVNRDGTVRAGTGFASEQRATGHYTVEFPPGTFEGCHSPIVTVTPFTFDPGVVANVFGLFCGGDGSAAFDVKLETSAGVPTDTTFMFIAA